MRTLSRYQYEGVASAKISWLHQYACCQWGGEGEEGWGGQARVAIPRQEQEQAGRQLRYLIVHAKLKLNYLPTVCRRVREGVGQPLFQSHRCPPPASPPSLQRGASIPIRLFPWLSVRPSNRLFTLSHCLTDWIRINSFDPPRRPLSYMLPSPCSAGESQPHHPHHHRPHVSQPKSLPASCACAWLTYVNSII